MERTLPPAVAVRKLHGAELQARARIDRPRTPPPRTARSEVRDLLILGGLAVLGMGLALGLQALARHDDGELMIWTRGDVFSQGMRAFHHGRRYLALRDTAAEPQRGDPDWREIGTGEER